MRIAHGVARGARQTQDSSLQESRSITFESERLQPRADWHPNPPKRGSGANGILASTAELDTCRLSVIGLRESLGLLVWACAGDCKRVVL